MFTKLAYKVLDSITDIFPSFGPKVFQKKFLAIFGSAKAYSYYLKAYQNQLLQTEKFEKILIIVDLNIGDAILLQKSIEAVKDNFPHALVDYACNKLGGELLTHLPEADVVYNFFKGGMPSLNEIGDLNEIIEFNKYDLILNLSPFLKKKSFLRGVNVIQLIVPFTAYILYLWKANEKTHISNIVSCFLNDFLKPARIENKNKLQILNNTSSPSEFEGNKVFISHEAILTARSFVNSHGIFSMERLLLFNPDVTVKYSMIPFETQVSILKKILESGETDYILISTAYFNKGLEYKILKSLPEEFQQKVIIVSPMPLDAFVALIDLCDVFLTGDTGPLHIAASWKAPIDKTDELRNQTAVISIIGPTDSAMFCYDSDKTGHLPANQDAPSKVFVSSAPCRNITCLNKTIKTCKEIRCFTGINSDEISSYIISYLRYLRIPVKKFG